MATKIKMIHPKAMLTISFYKEYQNKILNEYKYENAIKPVYCFYEPKDGNSFLRFEEFSFDPSKNPQVTGKLFSMQGLIVHYATIDSFKKLDNLETVYDCLKKSKEKLQFILFIYGDLKTFLFSFKFILLHNKGVEYKISAVKKEIGEDIQKKLNEISEKNKDKIIEEFSHLLSEDTILLYDINSEINTIPILIKNDILTPDTNNKDTIDITIITPVPKSGCNIIKPNTNITTKRIGNTEDLISLILLLAKYLAVKIIKPNFAASLG